MSVINATPIAKQSEVTANTTGGDARARAIAAFTKTQAAPTPQAQSTPVSNPSQVAPEELAALQAPGTPKESTEAAAEPAAAEGQPNTSEAPKEATKEVSPQLAQLARKERAIRQQAQELKAREAAIAAREEALKPQAPAVDLSKYIPVEELTKNPWELLQKHGMTYDQLTQAALNQPSPEQIALNQQLEALKAEIKSLKDGQDGVKKTFEEGQKQQYTQAVNQIRNEAKSLITNNPEFEAIAHTNSVNDVVELIERTFHEDGTLLTVEEAAREIENHLVEEAMKLSSLNKIKQRLKPAAPQAATEKPAGEAPKQSQPKPTLTNAMGATRPLTPKERAILAFRGELKK